MRTLVLIVTAFLTLTGVSLVWVFTSSYQDEGQRWVSLGHIWGGLFFMVIFPMYAWDHVTTNRRWLLRLRLVSASGWFQLLSGGVLILTGMVLLLYGQQAWATLRQAHHWLTYPLAASILLHFAAKKTWR